MTTYWNISEPFVIAVSSVIHVLESTGINVMIISIIAVYKQDEGLNHSELRIFIVILNRDYLLNIALFRTNKGCRGDPFTFASDINPDCD